MPFQVLDGDQAVPGSSLRLNGVVYAPDYTGKDYVDIAVALQDSNNTVLATGTVDAYDADGTFNPVDAEGELSGTVSGGLIKLSGTLDIPSDVPTSEAGKLTYIVWTVEFEDGNNAYSIEPISIYAGTGIPFGLENTLGLEGFPVKGVIQIPVSSDDTFYYAVDIDVYSPLPTNEKVATLKIDREFDSDTNKFDNLINSSDIVLIKGSEDRAVIEDNFELGEVYFLVNGTDGGRIVYDPNFYSNSTTNTESTFKEGSVYNTANNSTREGYDAERSYQIEQDPSLDPYTLQWHMVKVTIENDDTEINNDNERTRKRTQHIGSSLSWIINNSISQAMHEMAQAMERGIAVPGLLQDAFSNADYMMYLKMGRDFFNMLDRTPSQFTMIAADGHMRLAWLTCAQFQAASSKQLQEALKTFDFSGASTSLNVDLASAYETYKSSLESMLESTVKPYKRQLVIRNLLSGDGATHELLGGPSVAQGWTESTVLNRGTLRSRYR